MDAHCGACRQPCRSDTSTERLNIWAVKLDSSGAVDWGKTYDASSRDEVAGAFQTNDGGFIIGGDSSVNEGANATALYVNLLKENLEGDVLLGGTATLDTEEIGGAELEPVVIEVTTGGVPSAAYSLDYPGYQEVGSVLHVGPERYIFVGMTATTGGGEYFAARFDKGTAPLEINWALTFWSHDRVTPHLEAAWAFDGNFIVAGPGNPDSVYTFRMDPSTGSQVDRAWRRHLAGSSYR